ILRQSYSVLLGLAGAQSSCKSIILDLGDSKKYFSINFFELKHAILPQPSSWLELFSPVLL
ncbi:hypothetical protein, partial [Francisella tularensis]|uniref:hypothetical protein n=1 Tax=Francisella tularensis TaxID=263 RepID=UPI001CD670FF